MKTFVVLLIFCIPIYIQPQPFQPIHLKVGNFFIFDFNMTSINILERIEIVDSSIILNNKNYYKILNCRLDYNSDGNISYHSSYSYVRKNNGYFTQYNLSNNKEEIYFKENCQVGDSWYAYDSTYICRVVDTGYTQLFLDETKCFEIIEENIEYGINIYLKHWTYDFGIIYWENLTIGHSMPLISCKIDNNVYGDTTFYTWTPTLVEDRPLFISYSLKQNYPNPFNPTTTIHYSLPKSGFVQLKVYDLLGREVANIVNTEQSVGNYKVEFNASNLTSGVYFYRLQSGGFVETKKLMLLR